MRVSVIIFPGSNCDRDVIHAIEHTSGAHVTSVFHDDSALPEDTDLVVLPGGFSYGDYLRSGAMAARSPIMRAVKEHEAAGGLILGICNGFQILTEARLLPGALLPNESGKFICKPCHVRVERSDTPFTGAYDDGQVVQFPIAHHEGLFYMPQDELAELERSNLVVFRYCGADGDMDKNGQKYCPNGSFNSIAGIINVKNTVLGLMPHPERASEPILGGTDGRAMWSALRVWTNRGVKIS